VDVTQEDLDAAVRKVSTSCAVAVAVARTFPKSSRITVDVHSIRFTNGDRRYTYLCPPSVAAYIVAFDAGDELHPFRFRLRDDQRLVVRRERKTDDGKALNAAKTKERYAKAKAEKIAADPETTEAQRVAATERAMAAEHALQAVRAEVKAKAVPVSVTETHPDVPPSGQQTKSSGRTVVRSTRSYGHREMRVNNDPGPGDFRGPLDIPDDEL
jgi:hypothetical protein